MPGPPLPEADIRKLAQEAIAAGRVPVLLSLSFSAGYGQGDPCCICNRQITPAQVEYEVTIAGLGRFNFHLTCHAHWQLECVQRMHSGQASGAA